jgi:phage shock protein PspC (stress-responsive transcriptional regulator)
MKKQFTKLMCSNNRDGFSMFGVISGACCFYGFNISMVRTIVVLLTLFWCLMSVTGIMAIPLYILILNCFIPSYNTKYDLNVVQWINVKEKLPNPEELIWLRDYDGSEYRASLPKFSLHKGVRYEISLAVLNDIQVSHWAKIK